jgi:hypothetical protein
VTLPSNAAGPWQVWVTSVATVSSYDYGHPSRGDLQVFGTPHIDSITPSYGIAGMTAGVTVNGTNLDGVTGVNVTGSGCPGSSCGLNATLADDPSATSVPFTVNIVSGAASGSYQLSLISGPLQSNAVTFTVADGSPIIDYIVQPSLQPGQSATIVINGSGFGPGCSSAACGVTICPSGTSCNSSDVHPSVTFWSDAQITVQLIIDSTAAGSYDVTVISGGASGLSFSPAPNGKTASKSAPKPITIKGNPHLTLQVTASNADAGVLTQTSGQGTSDCAYIDTTPSMPQISARIVTDDATNYPVTGNVTWSLDLNYTWIWRDPQSGGIIPVSQVGATQSVSQPANQTWNIPWSAQSSATPSGGYATINWTYNGQPQDAFKFRICGKNPNPGDADSLLNAGGFWFARNITIHETNESQFCELGRSQKGGCAPNSTLGLPVFGYPAGYGLMQLDPVDSSGSQTGPVDSSNEIWNWRTNIAGGLNRIQTKAGPQSYSATSMQAYPLWIRQVRNWNTYNGKNSTQAPPPSDDDFSSTGGTCKFTLPLDANGVGIEGPASLPAGTHWFGDAIVMKQYGGANTGQYLIWDATGKKWTKVRASFIYKKNGDKEYHTFPYEYCTCTSAVSCQSQTPDQYK